MKAELSHETFNFVSFEYVNVASRFQIANHCFEKKPIKVSCPWLDQHLSVSKQKVQVPLLFGWKNVEVDNHFLTILSCVAYQCSTHDCLWLFEVKNITSKQTNQKPKICSSHWFFGSKTPTLTHRGECLMHATNCSEKRPLPPLLAR